MVKLIVYKCDVCGERFEMPENVTPSTLTINPKTTYARDDTLCINNNTYVLNTANIHPTYAFKAEPTKQLCDRCASIINDAVHPTPTK